MLTSPMSMLFLLQEGPADTTAYMIAGYAVIFGVLLIYLASLALRRRNLRQDLEVLTGLDREEESPQVSRERVGERK